MTGFPQVKRLFLHGTSSVRNAFQLRVIYFKCNNNGQVSEIMLAQTTSPPPPQNITYNQGLFSRR
jgi:hypothetical protein